MKKMKLGILLVALAAALSGCSDAGTENKEDPFYDTCRQAYDKSMCRI